MAAMTTSVLSMRVAAVPQRVTTGRRTAAAKSTRPRATVCASAVKASGSAVGKAVEKVSAALPAAAFSVAALLATARPPRAPYPRSPAEADTLQEAKQFLQAFWEFRTGNPTSFFALTVLPIVGPYAIFQVLIGQKAEVQREKLREGKWDVFMSERGLEMETLTLRQLNGFVAAAEKDLLDDGMVAEFVRQLQLSEKWAKSTIEMEDPRLLAAKQRARAEKILAMKEARAKETAGTSVE